MSRAALAPFSAAYGAAVSARAAMYRRGWLRCESAAVPVISIGNLAAGGTGKTPVVELVARLLHEAGHSPAIISRGYGGRRSQDPLTVSDGSGSEPAVGPAEAGDEPVMLARALPHVPVIVARRRANGASLAVSRYGARSLVLDDGFQHLALARDLDLVLLDAARPFDNGRLLPSGFLREPPAALARAGALILSGAAGPAPASSNGGSAGEAGLREWLRPGTPVFHCEFRPIELTGPGAAAGRPLEWLRGRRIVAFAGIARPERFARMLRELHAATEEFIAFPDHHVYSPADADRLASRLRETGADALLTTEKDLARLTGSDASRRLEAAGLLALRGQAVMNPQEASHFTEVILEAARAGEGGIGH